METLRIEIRGFTDEEIGHLLSRLEKSSSIASLVRGLDLTASAQDVLTSVLTDTTLIAHIAEQAVGMTVSLKTIINIVRDWKAKVPERDGQQMEVSGPDVQERERP